MGERYFYPLAFCFFGIACPVFYLVLSVPTPLYLQVATVLMLNFFGIPLGAWAAVILWNRYRKRAA